MEKRVRFNPDISVVNVEKYIEKPYIPKDFDFSENPETAFSIFCIGYQQEYRINYPDYSKEEILELLKNAWKDILELKPNTHHQLQKRANAINKKRTNLRMQIYRRWNFPKGNS